MRALVFTLLSVVCTVSLAATVYRWVNENGVVHYSDQPHQNAQKVELKAPQTYSAPRTAPAAPAAADAANAKPDASYQSCAIASPANDQMFMNAFEVTAGVSLQPGLRPGDRVIVTLDGQRLPGVPPSGGQFSISPVDRGTHTIQASVMDPDGQTVCQSPSVTFHVHQQSRQAPNPANRPKS